MAEFSLFLKTACKIPPIILQNANYFCIPLLALLNFMSPERGISCNVFQPCKTRQS